MTLGWFAEAVPSPRIEKTSFTASFLPASSRSSASPHIETQGVVGESLLIVVALPQAAHDISARMHGQPDQLVKVTMTMTNGSESKLQVPAP